MPEETSSTNPILELIQKRLKPGASLRPGQVAAIDGYWQRSQANRNIAIHLPTGYGKTLVGLAVAEYRRQVLKEKPVWLCPTRQLVFQVIERAREVDIPAYPFVGTLGGPDTVQKKRYNQWQVGNAIAVTVYERVFTRAIQEDHPDAAAAMTFDQATFAVLDDVHAAEQAVSAYWTLTLPRYLRFVDRRNQENAEDSFRNPAYFELLRSLNAFLPERIRKDHDFLHADAYTGTEKLQYDGAPIYCIPFPVLADRVEVVKAAISRWLRWKNLKGLMDDFKGFTNDYYDPLYFQRQVWDNLKDGLYFFHIFVSRGSIVLRPYLCPVGEHRVWMGIKNRLFMSATVRVDGEIQKLFGTEDIYHVQQTVDVVEATGRRLHLGLNWQNKVDGGGNELDSALREVERLVCITPSELDWKDLVQKAPSIDAKRVFDAGETEKTRNEFLAHSPAVLKYYGRYEGLDVPNEQCRSVLLYRLPDGLSPMEKFLNYEIGCQDLIQVRIASRLEQGLGRCNRKPEDFSLILLDQDVLTWILNRQELLSEFVVHEMRFSLALPEIEDPASLVRRFLTQPEVRSQVAANYDSAIVGRDRQVSVGASAPDGTVWLDELRFAARFWQRRPKDACDHAIRVVSFYREAAGQAESAGDTRRAEGGWRRAAWWCYLAGIARAYADRKPGSVFDYTHALALWGEARSYMEESHAEEEKLEWWTKAMRATGQVGAGVLKKALEMQPPEEGSLDAHCLRSQVLVFQSLLRSREFFIRCSQLRDFLQIDERTAVGGQTASRQFERGIEIVGTWLGFETKGAKAKAADGVWRARPSAEPKQQSVIIFEAKSSEQGKPSDPVSRESLQQLDTWRALETYEAGLTGDEEILLVRIGRQKEVVAAGLSDAEKVFYAGLADSKSILLVRDLQDFVQALLSAFEETYAVCMKQRGIQEDRESLSRCLHFLAKEKKALPSDFVSLLRERTYRRPKAQGAP